MLDRTQDQDWQTIILRKKQPNFTTSEQNINAARRQNLAINTDVKTSAVNKSTNVINASVNSRKLDNETEDFHLKKVPMDVAKVIEKGRLAKKLTQDALAKSLNMQAKQINEIERGQALYNGQQLARIKRFLGV